MFRVVLVTFSLFTMFLGPAAATDGSTCPAMPHVEWWKNSSHEEIIKYADRKYGGNWKSYIAKWQLQRKFYRGILDRGTRAVFKQANVVLSGGDLADYIDKVDQRIAVIRCLAANAGAADEPQLGGRPGDPDVGKAKASVGGCTGCHGDAGVAVHPLIPNLVGQHQTYLQTQLVRFRAMPTDADKRGGLSPVRHDRMMTPIARELTDDDIKDLSAFFSDLACEATNIPAPSVPAALSHCIDCHGAEGMSERAHVPNLAGQKKGYLIRQLELFRNTGNDIAFVDEEDVHYQETMAQKGKNLSDQTISDLAMYFSSLTCR